MRSAQSKNEHSVRQLKVAEAVHHALMCNIYAKDMFLGHIEKDAVDIRRVEISRDLRYAKVYWLPNEISSATKVKATDSTR
jgi:ribosome-binding factor A